MQQIEKISWFQPERFGNGKLPQPYTILHTKIEREPMETDLQYVFRICFLLKFVKDGNSMVEWINQSKMLRNVVFLGCEYDKSVQSVLNAYLSMT